MKNDFFDFVESERFASRIGDCTITGLNTHAATASVLAAKQAKVNDAAHHGENRGTQPAILYMFYLSQEGLPLSVPNPEMKQ